MSTTETLWWTCLFVDRYRRFRYAEAMKISLIIPTKDRPEELTRLLRTLFRQTRKPDELLIIDDGSLDFSWLRNLIGDRMIMTYRKKDKPGLTRSRNLGIEIASGDIICFLDDDVEIADNYFESVEKAFLHDTEKKVGGVASYVVFEKKTALRYMKNFFERLALLRGRPGSVLSTTANTYVEKKPKAVVSVDWLPGCAMSFRKEVFAKHTFDTYFTEYGLGEDLEFTMRIKKAGWRLLVTPFTHVYHHHAPASRIAERRLGYMMVHNHRYIFEKHIPQTAWNKFKFGWSVLGMMKLEVLNKLSNPFKNRGGRLRGMWNAATEERQLPDVRKEVS